VFMKMKCYFCFPDGHYCEKWAKAGSRFCHHHQPPAPTADTSKMPLHSHARLATFEDLFHFIRESMLAVRMGSISPGQAFAISSLSDRWIATRRRMGFEDSRNALRHQILPTLVDAEAAADLEREARTAAEAERRSEEIELAARANTELEFVAAQAAQRAEAQSAAREAGGNGHHDSPSPAATVPSEPALSESAKSAPSANSGVRSTSRFRTPVESTGTRQPEPSESRNRTAGSPPSEISELKSAIPPSAPAPSGNNSQHQSPSPVPVAPAEPPLSAPSLSPSAKSASSADSPSLPADFSARIIARLEREILKSTVKNLRQRPRDG
jgi:hypothetical protein